MSEQPSQELQAEFDFVKWGAELTANLSKSLGGVWLRGARAVPIGTAANATTRPTNNPGRIVGWSLHNVDATNAATIMLYDGADNAGDLIASVSLLPEQSTAFEHSGIAVTRGLFVEIVPAAGTAAVRGAIYLGATD